MWVATFFISTKIGFLVFSVFTSPRAASRATSFYVCQVGPPCFVALKQQNYHKYFNQHDRHLHHHYQHDHHHPDGDEDYGRVPPLR